MKRLAWLPLPLLLAGCMNDEVSQSGSAVVNCSGGFINICRATQHNTFAPTAEEALFWGLVAAAVLVLLLVLPLLLRKPGD